MKLDSAEMVLLLSDGKYREAAERLAAHFGITIPYEYEFEVNRSQDYYASVSIRTHNDLYQWCSAYGFEKPGIAAYYRPRDSKQIRIYLPE